MRIGILASPAYPIPPLKYGGTERVIYHLIRGLKQLGHEPVLFGAGDSQVDCEIIPIAAKSLPFERDLVDEAQTASIRKQAMMHACEIVQDNLSKIDILHVHESVPYCDVSKLDIPVVTTMHGIFHFNNMDFFLERNRNMLWVNISESQKSTLPQLNYIGTVHNGLDVNEFECNDHPVADQMCWVGRFSAEKGTHLAMQLAHKANYKLVMGGKIDFVDREYFIEQCYPYITSFDNNKVTYLGELGMSEKLNVFKNSYANLHLAPWREPFGYTVIEAALCGTPTIGFNRGALKETIVDGETGLLVEDIEEAFVRLPELQHINRKKVADRAAKLYNHILMTKKYVKAYEHAIDIYNSGAFEDANKMKKLLEKSQAEVAKVQA